MSALRVTLLLGIAAAYAAAVLAQDDPLPMAVGLAPLAWIALEGGWRLFAPQR